MPKASKYNKPAKTIDEQISLLKQRGLIINDIEKARSHLGVISFFRLSVYMRPFEIRHDKDHKFKSNTNFQSIVDLYNFDRELRLLLMDAIERVEVATRTVINNHMSIKYQTKKTHSGSHWFLNKLLFKRDYNHKRMLSNIESYQSKAQQELNNIYNIKKTMLLK